MSNKMFMCVEDVAEEMAFPFHMPINSYTQIK